MKENNEKIERKKKYSKSIKLQTMCKDDDEKKCAKINEEELS